MKSNRKYQNGDVVNGLKIVGYSTTTKYTKTKRYECECVHCGHLLFLQVSKISETHCPNCKESHLYFILCGEFMKIGTSCNMQHRLRTMMTDNPYDFEVYRLYEHQGSKEFLIQDILTERGYHHRLEWFRIDPETLDDIMHQELIFEEVATPDVSHRNA